MVGIEKPEALQTVAEIQAHVLFLDAGDLGAEEGDGISVLGVEPRFEHGVEIRACGYLLDCFQCVACHPRFYRVLACAFIIGLA